MVRNKSARVSRILLFAACASGALAASPALAQPAGENVIGEVVVTAQRREERAQDVPVVVNAFSEERLEQLDINEPQDLYGTVPSLVVGNQGTSSREAQSFSIRGQATGYQSSPAVVIYLNEVPLPSTGLGLQGGPGLIADLESVQVLSGPQGTLFGRNTTGGAVLYSPRKPSNTFGGYLEGSFGNYDMKGVEGAINVPLVPDKLLVRAVGAFQDRRGYTEDIVWNKWRDDTHWASGRLGVTFRPTESIENYLLLYLSDSSNNGAGHIHQNFNIPALQALQFCYEGPSIPFTIASCDVYRAQSQIADQIGPRKTRFNVDTYSKIRTWGAINTTSFEINDKLTFKNIFSYQQLKTDAAWDQDATPLQQYELNQSAPNPNFPVPGLVEFGLPRLGYNNGVPNLGESRGSEQLTEEVQLQGQMLDDRLNFVVGAFYYKSQSIGKNPSAQIIYCPAEFTGLCPANLSGGGGSNESKAIYAQATVDLGVLTPALDRLRFTAGLRKTWDEIIGETDRVLLSNAVLESDAPTWTVGLDYRPIDNLLIYGKASRGYKAGGFNGVAVRPETTTFDPEKLTTYEAGFKSDWRIADMPVRLNGAYYYSDYTNIQRPTGDFNPDNNQSGAQILGAEATIQGFELEGMVRPHRYVELGGSLSYTDPKYEKFETVVFLPTQACNGLVAPGGLADFSCMPFQFTTEWIYNIYGSVDLPIPERLGELSLYVSYSHVGEQPTAPLGNAITEPGSVLESHGLLNASLTWKDVAQSGVDLTLFGNNLTDETYRVSNSNVYGSLLVQSALYGEPRMYGLKLRYRFGGE
jgi:iron complex outermembrane recepter protein